MDSIICTKKEGVIIVDLLYIIELLNWFVSSILSDSIRVMAKTSKVRLWL